MQELELVRLAASGDHEAFAKLVRQYQGLVRAVAYSLTADIELSEDIAQETFLAAWRALPRLREHASFRAWLCSTARNLAVSAVRKRGSPAAVPTTDPIKTPRAHAISQEEHRLMWQAVARIPEACRVPLLLYYQEGQSVARVAEVLGISENAAKQRLFRGRQLVRDEVAVLVHDGLARERTPHSLVPAVMASLPRFNAFPATAVSASASAILAPLITGGQAKAVAAVLAVLAGLLALFGNGNEEPSGEVRAEKAVLSAHERSASRGSDASALPAGGGAASEANGRPTADPTLEHEIVPPEVADSTGAESGNPTGKARIRLARSQLNAGWEDRPMQAAPNLCLKGWAYLALLGDPEGKRRLMERALALDENSQNANRLLLWYLDDHEAQAKLAAIVQETSRPLAVRLDAFEALVGPPYADKIALQTPEEIEDYYRDECSQNLFSIEALRRLSGAATIRSAPFLRETAEMFAFGDPQHVRSRPGGAFGPSRATTIGPVPGGNGAVPNECIATMAMGALGRLRDTEACLLLREIAVEGFSGNVCRGALHALQELGDHEFTRRTLLHHAAMDPRLDERIQYAALLAEEGGLKSRFLFYEGLKSGDASTRALAYGTLSRLGDDAFVEVAAADWDPQSSEANGIFSITFADQGRDGPRKQSSKGYMSDAVARYLVKLAEQAPNPKMVDQAICSLLSAESSLIAPAVPLARGVLDGPVAVWRDGTRGENPLEFSQHLRKLGVLLRAGEGPVRERTAQRVRQMYMGSGEDGRFEVLWSLGWAPAPELADLYARAITDSTRANTRLVAAVHLLAAEAGVIPE